jgi:hypothetical protein
MYSRERAGENMSYIKEREAGVGKERKARRERQRWATVKAD